MKQHNNGMPHPLHGGYRSSARLAQWESIRRHHEEGHDSAHGGRSGGRPDDRAGFGDEFGGGFRAGFGPGFGPGFGAAFGPGFARGFRRGRGRAGRGDVRSAILSLLADGPSNGYGLIKAIGDRTHGAWTPSPGSVYPTLQQLVDEELIEAAGDGRRTEYRLTEAGRAYVEENAESLNAAWEATSVRGASQAAFYESVAKLVGVIQQVRVAGTQEQQKAAVEKLDELRRALYLILAD